MSEGKVSGNGVSKGMADQEKTYACGTAQRSAVPVFVRSFGNLRTDSGEDWGPERRLWA